MDAELLTVADEKHDENIYQFEYEDSYNDINYKIHCGIVDESTFDDEKLEDIPDGYSLWVNKIDITKNGETKQHKVNLHLA